MTDKAFFDFDIIFGDKSDMGFNCGQNVTVRHEKNKIIITVDNDTKTDE